MICPHPTLASSHSTLAQLAILFLKHTSHVATPGPLHVLHPLPGPLFLLLSAWLASSLPFWSFLHRYRL